MNGFPALVGAANVLESKISDVHTVEKNEIRVYIQAPLAHLIQRLANISEIYLIESVCVAQRLAILY